MSDTFDTIKVEPERDRFGRYLIHPAKGGKPKAYTRATTIAETLDDRFNLEAWKQRMVALGLAQRPDLYASVASLQADEKTALNRLCDQAREAAAGSAGANLGTALHRFTERINRGEEVRVPAPWDADIAAYTAAIADSPWVIHRQYLERIVVLDGLGVAGMFDLLLYPQEGSSAPTCIADLKTGATLDFSWCAIAVQLAIYAHADTIYDPATKTHETMPPVDQDTALVIHLPAGKATCTLYEVDIAAGWEAAQHALWTRNWRKRKNLAVPATQIVSGGASTREDEGSSAATSTPSTDTLGGGDDLNLPAAVDVTPAVDVGGGDTPTPAPTVEPAPPADPTPFEGGPADPAAITELREKFEALTITQRAWIGTIFKEAKHHKRSLSLAVGEPTQRKYWIGVGILWLAGVNDDGTFLHTVLVDILGVNTAGSFGEHLSLLTCEQAALFAFAAEHLANGGALIYENDGTARIQAA